MDGIGILENDAHLLEGQKTRVSRREVRDAQMWRRCSESVMELVKVDVVAVHQYIKKKANKNIDCLRRVARKLQARIVADNMIRSERIRF
jgi:hypothetical protein